MVDYIIGFIIAAVCGVFGFFLGTGLDGLDVAGSGALSIIFPMCYILWTVHRKTADKLKIYEHRIQTLEKKLENINEKKHLIFYSYPVKISGYEFFIQNLCVSMGLTPYSPQGGEKNDKL